MKRSVVASLPALFYAAVGVALYGRTLGLPFTTDDFIWLYEASHLASPWDLLRVHHFDFVRPVSSLYFWLVYRVAGLDPTAFRAASLALHVATAALLHHLVARLGGRPSAGWAAGLLFLAYCQHWESVWWPSAVGEVLQGVFMIASLLAHLDRRRVLAGLLLAVALLTKETAFVMPLVLLLADRLVGDRGPGWVRRHAPYWAMAAAWGIAETMLIGQARGIVPHLSGGFGTAFLRYLEGTVLTFDYVADLPTWLLGAVALALALALRQAPAVTFFALWMAAACLPYAGFAPGQLMPERYAYLPSLGFCGMAGELLAAVSARSRPVATLALVGCAAAHGIALWATLQALPARAPAAQSEAWQIPAALSHLAPHGAVYVYGPVTRAHYASHAVALYGHLPMERVHDWYAILERQAVAPGDVMLFHEAATNRYLDLTDTVRRHLADHAAHRGDPPGATAWPLPPAPMPLVTWDLRNAADGADWIAVGMRREAPGVYVTPGRGGMLVGPELGWNPLVVASVQVACRGARGPAVLGWSSARDSAYSTRRSVTARFGEVFHPMDRSAWWTEGRLGRLYLIPSTTPARVEIQAIRVVGFPSPRVLR